MSAHTPGPWTVRDIPTTSGRYIGPANDGGAPSVGFVLSRVNIHDAQIAADARLIAAAPELFDALERLVLQCNRLRLPGQGATDAERNAVRVIVKATGEHS